ncbi:hypothetical protein EVAR_29476_1 [Eumeta japonica]|uniref:Uncharacterized protein n=1 Tax=Eumeta variegata TaxID=151549 RepID=A0A4C1WU50_EUMVA|nr:hypothetical protein EVAR_29476_1 [Eumeta japonica]
MSVKRERRAQIAAHGVLWPLSTFLRNGRYSLHKALIHKGAKERTNRGTASTTRHDKAVMWCSPIEISIFFSYSKHRHSAVPPISARVSLLSSAWRRVDRIYNRDEALSPPARPVTWYFEDFPPPVNGSRSMASLYNTSLTQAFSTLSTHIDSHEKQQRVARGWANDIETIDDTDRIESQQSAIGTSLRQCAMEAQKREYTTKPSIPRINLALSLPVLERASALKRPLCRPHTARRAGRVLFYDHKHSIVKLYRAQSSK